MRIQLKLFLLLVVIAVLPLAALSWRSELATENLGRSLTSFERGAATQEIETRLSQAVDYASDLLAAQQREVELALRIQAAQVERRLNGKAPSGEIKTYLHSDFDASATWPPGTELALDHAIAAPGRAIQAAPISRDHQSFFVPEGLDPAEARSFMDRLASMDTVYKDVNEASPSLFYWQYVTLKDGLHSAYPGHGGYPAGYDARDRVWYKEAVVGNGGDIIWSAPLLDASTRRLLLSAATPIHMTSEAGTEIEGVTGIDIDILDILNGIQSRVRVSGDAESHIIQLIGADGAPYRRGADGKPQIRVIASSTYKDSGAAWNAVPQSPELTVDARTDLSAMIGDLAAGHDGIRALPYHGQPALWVYGPLEQRLGSALLYIVPLHDIEAMADAAQDSVRKAVVDQVRLAGFASLGLIAIVAVLGIVASRSVTEPLRDLATAARELAGGNLEARAPKFGNDEVGELADVFNAMVPELRSHIAVKESLALAREVQQKLLPTSAPSVPGFDIAGTSVYSEAIGGDYYDFMSLADENGRRRVGVVIGDVSGHGVVAALTMMSVRALLRSYAGDGTALRPVMRAVNRHLTADTAAGRFVTLVYVVISPESRHVRWISAGHGPILFYDMHGKHFEELAVHDIPLGVKADWPFHESDREVWPPEGIIVIGTDGIWEAKNPQGEMFGKEGLMSVIRATAHLPADEICSRTVERLREFSGSVPQADDVTLVVIKFLPRAQA